MASPPCQLSFGGEFDRKPESRLLFMIRPDGSATSRLMRLMGRLRCEGAMLGRAIEAHRLHITLHHIGDFIDQTPFSLLRTAEQAAATVKKPPFGVALDRIVGTRRSLLLRPSDGSPALRAFQRALGVALIKAGLHYHVDPTFSPHVTLSYDFCDFPERSIEPIIWTVRQFFLIESLLGKHRHIEHNCWPIHA